MHHKNRKYEFENDKQPQVPNKSHYVDNIDVEILDIVPIENDNLDSVPIENENLDSLPIENDNIDSVSITDEANNDCDNFEKVNSENHNVDYDIFDPRNWDHLQPKLIDLLVVKGPKRDDYIVKGLRDSLNRRFTTNLYMLDL
ncbi:unnamed protein product [Vicia faba]|uniref:Uncharacterized protein n=1 Tax=Vicia faba TaxID=3906 RepID=A0AAV1ATL3_VICFA|nr:unnamed protein product [Vicia faba]